MRDRRSARDRCLCCRRVPQGEVGIQLPTRGCTYRDPGESCRYASDPRSARQDRPRETLRHRLVEDRGVDLAPVVGLRPVACKPRSLLRVCSKVGIDLGAPRLGQPSVDIALQIRLGKRTFAHLMTCKRPDAGNPSISARSFSRPRERRDMTVPMGMPSAAAASS